MKRTRVMMCPFHLMVAVVIIFLPYFGFSQKKKGDEASKVKTTQEMVIDGLKFRSLGPALMSGRISDIAIDPKSPSTWYVTAGSGGVWKTVNAGHTWEPIFDSYDVFSIGCVTIDPNQSNIIWIGTGENVGGRHVGFGDGIYKSNDGGKSFTNMGLKASEHISKIVVHPTNSDVIWVAAQGPLWSKGGDRGVYMSEDGGSTWNQVLGDKEWVGATDLVIHPDYPQILYAATWQRHRTIAAYMGGGPGTAIHKSIDGGRTWSKLTNGLPESNMGKIGLAISPQVPDVVYAAIELDRRTGGIYRSADAGANWTKMSDAVAGATGPHYYQELYASPHAFDRIYLMDVRVQVSNDGGKTVNILQEDNKHSDNHAMAFLPDRPDYLLIGTDGGLYESHDLAKNWRFFANLPLTQFYDIALDDSYPFYNVYGGTQDNSTQGGPVRNDKVQGIANCDWSVVLDWDGQQPATEPGNPNVVYAQRQEGTLSRIDMVSRQVTDIQPVASPDEAPERYNWDAPILISPHDPKTVFFASQRLWKSTDRGDSWQAISGDLTKNQNRLQLPIMGSTQSYDNAWDVLAMSNFNTITMIAESPIQKGLIYIGTDDGLIQITDNGGQSWQRLEVRNLPGCPAEAYVNEIKADLFDANIVYVSLDNHKSGDFNPYLYKSTDKGRTWKSMKGDFPSRNFVWRLVQDHVEPNLIFAASEFGLYVTLNGGINWHKMTGGLPTISFRDLAIHRRDNDLVAATFGRGIYVLDDITPLRTITAKATSEPFTFFDVSDAFWFIPKSHLGFDGPKGDQGADYFVAPNPAFGATFSYLVNQEILSPEALRKKNEIDAQVVKFPDWKDIHNQQMAPSPSIYFIIKNDDGAIVQKLKAPVGKGFHQVTWDLKYGSMAGGSSNLVPPDTYTAEMVLDSLGMFIDLGMKKSFKLIPIFENSLQTASYDDVADFWRSVEKANSDVSNFTEKLNMTNKLALNLKNTVEQAPIVDLTAAAEAQIIIQKLDAISVIVNGMPERDKIGEKNPATLGSMLFDLHRGVGGATYGPTVTNRNSLEWIQGILDQQMPRLEQISNSLNSLVLRTERELGVFIPRQ